MKKLLRNIYYLAALMLLKVIRFLPYSLAVQVGGIIGSSAYYIPSEARQICEQNLSLAFPKKTLKEIKEIARQVFSNQGKNLFELLSYPKLGKKEISGIVKIEGRDKMARAFENGKGVIMASAHCGNWEILGAALSFEGFPINVIAKKIYIEGLNRLLLSLRNSKGLKIIFRSERDSARQILRGLRKKECIAMLIDQDTEVQGVFVDYFSRPAWTPSGLASIALKTGASVILALDTRMPDDSHVIMIDGPLELEKTGDMQKDISLNTKAITALIENHVRKYPSQWVWMHKRWKTRPPSNHDAVARVSKEQYS